MVLLLRVINLTSWIEFLTIEVDSAVCSQIGADVLEEGGNAVDATVSTALCLGVAQPFASGIGGGAFMLIRLANGTAVVIDARDAAPGAALPDMYEGQPRASKEGGRAIAVPGELHGLYTAWLRFGSLEWSRLVRPARELAGEMTVSELFAKRLHDGKESILASPTLREEYAPNGEVPKEGDVLRRPNLERTLRTVEEQGGFAFFQPPLATQMAEDIQSQGGIITEQDFLDYQTIVR